MSIFVDCDSVDALDSAFAAPVMGVPLRVEVPFLTSGPMSVQAAWHAVVIPRIDRTSVLSFGIGLALRARPNAM